MNSLYIFKFSNTTVVALLTALNLINIQLLIKKNKKKKIITIKRRKEEE